MSLTRRITGALCFCGILLLYGAGPVQEGATVWVKLGTGQYEPTSFGSTALVRHQEARVGARHGFKSGALVVLEGGMTNETEAKALRFQEKGETNEEFAERNFVPLDPDRRYHQYGTMLLRGGYQWKYVGFELGPNWSTNGQAYPLPSAIFRVTPTEEFYVYASVLDSAQLPERNGFGFGGGWQSNALRLDISARLTETSPGFRVVGELPIGKRLWAGASSQFLEYGHFYPQWNAYAHVSYYFGSLRKRETSLIHEPEAVRPKELSPPPISWE